MHKLRILPLLGCVTMALPVWGQSQSDVAKNPQVLLRQLDEGFAQVFERTAPSVVVVRTLKEPIGLEDDNRNPSPFNPPDFFFNAPDPGLRNLPFLQEPKRRHDGRRMMKGEGSGFIIRSDGYILTNFHVVGGAKEKITVKLKDGRQFPAKLVAGDEQTDIAVLKIDAKDIPPVIWADSDKARIGQLVCSIGAPFEMEYSFTIGCISGKGRSGLNPGNAAYEDYLQTSTLLNPGNSGGPLVDVEGRVVGMNTAVSDMDRTQGFAIPSNLLKATSEQLIEKGKVARPRLGIGIETLENSSLKEQVTGVEHGVVVTTIEPNTPAYKSDLRPADVITEIDNVPVLTAEELKRQVLSKKIGQTVTLNVWRGGKTLKVTLATAESPSALSGPPGSSPSKKPDQAEPDSASGLHLSDVTQADVDRLELKALTGALVTGIDPESPASIAGIQKDDVITEIDSKAAPNAEMARKLLQTHEGAKAVLLFLERKGQKTYAVLKNEN